MPKISVIIPAFKQERTIARDLTRIKSILESLQYTFEVIVVVDGMVDKTFKNAQKLASDNVKIIGYKKNQGKGHAVRVGMMRAKGDIVGFIDSGMDINPSGFSMLLNHLDWYNADIIIGSKLHPVSKINYPWYRIVLSWGYRLLTRILFGFKVRDTQVGLKFFKRKVIKNVLPRLLVKKYAFDVEILAVAYSLGFKRIYEAPIEINFQKGSNITWENFIKIIFLMLWDTMAVFYRLKILNYYKNNKFKKSS